MRRTSLESGEQIRQLRLDAGASLTQLGRLVGVHRSHLARIEAGRARPSLELLTAIGIALGADLSIRYFAGSGPRLRDRFQAAMVESLLRALDPRWKAELEVPIRRPSRGVIDLVLEDQTSPATLASEVQSQLSRLEEQIRWLHEKADGLRMRIAEENVGHPREVSSLLILRSTVGNRELARRYEALLRAAYPARTADVVAALTTSAAPWPGAGILWMSIEHGAARLMRHPPRGVALGR